MKRKNKEEKRAKDNPESGDKGNVGPSEEGSQGEGQSLEGARG